MAAPKPCSERLVNKHHSKGLRPGGASTSRALSATDVRFSVGHVSQPGLGHFLPQFGHALVAFSLAGAGARQRSHSVPLRILGSARLNPSIEYAERFTLRRNGLSGVDEHAIHSASSIGRLLDRRSPRSISMNSYAA